MPCDQINIMSVKIEAADRNLLELALNELGLEYVRIGNDFTIKIGYDFIFIREDKAELPETLQDTLNRIKQQYSIETIQEASMLHGWTVFEEQEEQGDQTLTLRRY